MSETTEDSETVRCDDFNVQLGCRCVRPKGHIGLHMSKKQGREVNWFNKCTVSYSPDGTVENTVFCTKPICHTDCHTGNRGAWEYSWLGDGQELCSITARYDTDVTVRGRFMSPLELPEKLEAISPIPVDEPANEPAPSTREQGPVERLVLPSITAQQLARELQNSMQLLHERADELIKENARLNRQLSRTCGKLKYVEDNCAVARRDRMSAEATIEKQASEVTGLQFKLERSANEITRLRRYVVALWLWCAFVTAYFLFLLYLKG